MGILRTEVIGDAEVMRRTYNCLTVFFRAYAQE